LRVETGAGVTAYPAIVDQEDAVGLRLFDTWGEAAFAHEQGVLRLLRFRLADKLKYLATHHGIGRAALLAWSSVDSPQRLAASFVLRCLADTAGELSRVRDPGAFEELCDRVRRDIGVTVQEESAVLDEALRLYGELAPRAGRRLERRLPEAHADIASQLQDLLYPGFLEDLFPGRLQHYPRYLKALRERLDQADRDPARDAQRMAQVAPWWQRYLETIEAGQPYDEDLDAYRWLVEEYRVSLFAQRLKTAVKVSEKRLADAWRTAAS
jgi:ATP-dependent helicase HrpA